ncbi:MAG: DNRLRE domain-containing protein [Actinomycetota bacterium]|nr:DNRLRE domain-containing protein [Actinomycetota bacterium]
MGGGLVNARVAKVGAFLLAMLMLTYLPAVPSSAQDPDRGAPDREELERERTATSKTFRNDDGTLTTVLYPTPVHYADDGRWKPISSDLVDAPSEAYAWRNEGNSFRALFKDTLGESFVKFVTPGGTSFSMELHGSLAAHAARGGDERPGQPQAEEAPPAEEPVPVASDAPSPKPESSPDPEPTAGEAPEDEGSEGDEATAEPSPEPSPESSPARTGEATEEPAPTASPKPQKFPGPPSRLTYSGAFDGVDLRYDVVPGGLKETLVLADASVPTRYRFSIAPDGDVPVDAEQRPDGSWAFYAAPEAGPAFVLDAPFAFDSSRHAVSAPDETHASLDVKEAGRKFLVTLEIDPSWLHDRDRVFPVFLDPTITIQPTVEDASFSAGCGGCTPFLSDRLYIGASDTSTWRAALQFNLGDVPPGAAVTSAALKLSYDGWCISAATACRTVTNQLDLHKMNKAWSATSTTSQLGFDAVPSSSFTLPAGAPSQWMNWDAAAIVKSWLSGTSPNYGFLLKKSDETLGSGGPVPPGRRFAEPSVMPKLEVTYVSDAVELYAPDTLHSNGADLRWSRYTGPTGAAFDRYEVHRSPTSPFTPSSSTLLATIRNVDQTTYRDTTAAPSKAFTYKIVANTSASNGQTVTLPATGQATKLLQPDPRAGSATSYSFWTTVTNCATYGADDDLWVGTYTDARWRSALSFDLSDIPANATVSSATLSLWQQYSADAAMTVDVHRATRAWKEGTGQATCTHDGATWYEADGGVAWTNQGGDFDPTPAASIAKAGGGSAGWDNFSITALAQSWVSGQAPNLGVILKARSDAAGTRNDVGYISDDYTVSPTLRPKLAISYADGSKAQGPTVAVTSPAANAKVAGSVKITADASDDRRVDKVELLKDGVVLATDTSAPYETTWNTTTADNGVRTLTARATDDAGNVTTSAPVSVTVENSAPPATNVTSPLGGATVKGTLTVSANATDDVGVERVEFYFDGNRIGLPDTAAPYSVSWNTLDPAQPAFDGAHELTTRAYDTHGQMTASAPVNVSAGNTAGTKYIGGWTSTAVPPVMTYDPALTTQQNQPIDVTITNNSGVTWSGTDVVLRYQWLKPDGTVAVTSGDISLGGDLRKSSSRTLRANVVPPALADGVDKAQYVLRLDLFEKSTAGYFSAKGNKPLDNPVIVNKAIKATALGLEHYYQYEGEPVGAGISQLTNVASGNSLLRWTPFSSPGRGLSTVVNLTYNSLEDRSDSPIGNNFSLSISSLSRLGLPIDIHPNKADEIAGRANKYVQFTDGDGTTFRFTQNAGGGWDEPPGVHLYLREYSTTDLTRKWAITRPDQVTFFYDSQGFPTSVQDRHGNRIEFTLQDIPPGEDPGNVKKRITTITDAAGLGATPAANRKYTIDYYSKSEAKKPQVRGKIEKILDHNGSALVFDYYEDGNLLRITQKGGVSAEGISTADRSVSFTYTTSDGSGPAIPLAADRVSPDAKTPNQSTRLYSVRDARGNETTFSYYGPTSGLDRWKLKTRTNRTGATTSFAYDNTGRITTVTAPMSRVSKFAYDTEGKVTQITNPKNELTKLLWSADRSVTKLTEPSGAYTEYAYNANGYMTDQKVLTARGPDGAIGTADDVLSHTALTYKNVAADTADPTGVKDVATRWKTGRSIPHVSLLETKTNPRGAATPAVPDDFQWTFTYDAANKNLIKVTEPVGSPRFTTQYTYNGDGTVATVTDANNRISTFNSYDANGLTSKMTDALGHVTQFGYDDDGLLRWVQDPNHSSYTGGDPRTYRTYMYYDAFHRLVRQSTPKSTKQNAPLLWSAGAYDPNDNVVSRFAPELGYEFVAGPENKSTFDAMDRVLTQANPQGETTSFTYDAAGRRTKVTTPKGQTTPAEDKDFATFLDYDALDRVIRETRYDTSTVPAKPLITHFCFDTAGDLRSVTKPKADVATVDCAAPPGFTRKHTYDLAHRMLTATDPLSHKTEYGYDADGNVETVTDAANDVTRRFYDGRGMLEKVVEPFMSTRSLTTLMRYDGVGNLTKAISPRAYDASGDKVTFTDFVTTYHYDALNRPTSIELPTKGAETKTYVYRDYDPNGNLLVTTLPDAATSLAAVPAAKKTTSTYFDTGWVASTDDAATPLTTFDYNGRGQQTFRKAGETTPELWTYASDGMLLERKDRDGAPVLYTYDENNNLKVAEDRSGIGVPGEKPVRIEVTYDSLDRVTKVRHRKEGAADSNYTFSTFSYDLNSNVSQRSDNGTESEAGSLVTAPKKHTFVYDDADWLKEQHDYLPSGCQKITNTFTATGKEASRVIRKATQACDASPAFSVKQSTEWTYFLNDKLKTLTTRNGPPSTDPAPGTIVESHDVDYLDPQGVYVNGHRTKDVFTKKGPAADCSTGSCTATYTYDARDKLVEETRMPGPKTTTYVLDTAGNVVKKTDPVATTFYEYTGMRLDRVALNTPTNYVSRYRYDAEGRTDCIVKPEYTGACAGAGTANLQKDYSYDLLGRLTGFKSYNTAGTVTDEATYEHDPLDRIVNQIEKHGSTPQRTTTFSYLALTDLVTQEKQSGNVATDATKSYSYDVYGNRISMENDPADATKQTETFTYGYDVHGSVSTLLDESGQARASYGYDAYGNKDIGLTGGDPNEDNPLNPYRYTAKRFDSGSKTLDMGARRFGPDAARFLQPDLYRGALSNLGLSTDPLTGNRYALAGGNPLSFIETDGHMVIADGGGGGGDATNFQLADSEASGGDGGGGGGSGGDSGDGGGGGFNWDSLLNIKEIGEWVSEITDEQIQRVGDIPEDFFEDTLGSRWAKYGDPVENWVEARLGQVRSLAGKLEKFTKWMGPVGLVSDYAGSDANNPVSKGASAIMSSAATSHPGVAAFDIVTGGGASATSDFVALTAETIVNPGLDNWEDWNESNLSGENGWLFQGAAKTGEWIAEETSDSFNLYEVDESTGDVSFQWNPVEWFDGM